MRDTCYTGDTRDGLRAFAAAGIKAQTCITSPPYWGLRDYGVPGQLGLEPTPAEYVAAMVDVFRCVRDVLADDGTLWLNLGDSYARNPAKGGSGTPNGKNGYGENYPAKAKLSRDGLDIGVEAPPKEKDLVGIPWRVAFALQADGWYLRSDIIWHKPNPMPESVTDRPTKAHEYLFLLTKQERYFYDAAAIAEAVAESTPARLANIRTSGAAVKVDATRNDAKPDMACGNSTSRNRRTVWTVATQPYSEAHFATFPPALVEPCVMAGTSQRGHCPACGKGWERVVERTAAEVKSPRSDYGHGAGRNDGGRSQLVGASVATKGWQPTCECNAGEPVPGIVLDPFMGSGTVAQVAQDLGRRWIGCELNPEYVALQGRRAAQKGLELA